MLMDRRIAFFYTQLVFNEHDEVTGNEEIRRDIRWAHRVDDIIVESTDVGAGGIVRSVNLLRRTYIIRPYEYLKRWGLRQDIADADREGFSSSFLVSEDGLIFRIRGLTAEGRNRLWQVEVELTQAG